MMTNLLCMLHLHTYFALKALLTPALQLFFALFAFLVTQEAFPARFKGFWTVKEPWFMDLLYAVIKPFLSQKIKDRVSGLLHMYSHAHVCTVYVRFTNTCTLKCVC